MDRRERNGVELGQRVRDVDGKDLGRVSDLYDEAFGVTKGFPLLFRQDRVIGYAEVRGVRDGALVVARSDRQLLDLAAGEVPESWRIPAPPDFPTLATPAEARGVFEELAAERARSTGSPPATAAPPAVVRDEGREYEARRGEEPVAPAPPAAHP